MVVPRIMLSVRYILSEIEETEREDNFRLKRFKELKNKKNKRDDDSNDKCYCDKKPGKGDDFVCAVCKKEEEKRKESKKSSGGFPSNCCASPEIIGDKASKLSTDNHKRLDELTSHLDKVISLTSQCKCEGLMSPSTETFIFACREVRSKIIEINKVQTEDCKVVQHPPCDVCTREVQTEDSDEKENLLGYFETKYKEIIKVTKIENDDGTVSEEKQVIKVTTERKSPRKPRAFDGNSCFNIGPTDSDLGGNSGFDIKGGKGDKICCTHPKKTKSDDIHIKKGKDCKLRSCHSDLVESNPSTKKAININEKPECCILCDAFTNPKTPSAASYECRPKKAPSGTGNDKSRNSMKVLSKEKSLHHTVSCTCKIETRTVSLDNIWRNVATSTTGLDKQTVEEIEELCICTEPEHVDDPKGKYKPMAEEKVSNSTELCCDIKDKRISHKKIIEKKASYPCNADVNNKEKDTKNLRTQVDIDTSTSNTNKPNIKFNVKPSLDKTHIRDIPSDAKHQSMGNNCCTVRIISRQKGEADGGEEKVEDVIIFGSIFDAIKKILAPSKSEENVTDDSRRTKDMNVRETCSCIPRMMDSPSKKSSVKTSLKSSTCKSCETASHRPFDGADDSSTYLSCKSAFEKSRSCPLCTKTEEKSIKWSQHRSQSFDDNTCYSNAQNKDSTRSFFSGQSLCRDGRDVCPKSSTTGSCVSRATTTSEGSSKVSCDGACINEEPSSPCNEQLESSSTIWRNIGKSPITSPKNNNNNECSDKCGSKKPLLTTRSTSSSKCRNQLGNRTPENVKSCTNFDTSKSCPVRNATRVEKSDKTEDTCSSFRKPSKPLCCGYEPWTSRDSNCEGIQDDTVKVMKDASTSTRRTDRYDVRSLKMMKSLGKLNCSCHSDSHLTRRRPQMPRKSRSCSSYHGDYFRW